MFINISQLLKQTIKINLKGTREIGPHSLLARYN